MFLRFRTFCFDRLGKRQLNRQLPERIEMPKLTRRLGQLCSITTGAPMSRIKRIKDGGIPIQAKVLVPGAMKEGDIVEAELVTEDVANVKERFFTRAGDVIVKGSTPYGCAYIDGSHAGLLTTSFSLILRPLQNSLIDMRYLHLFLNSPQSIHEMALISSGMAFQLVKKKDLAEMPIPVPPPAEQKRLAELCVQIRHLKKTCREIEEKSDALIEGELARVLFDN